MKYTFPLIFVFLSAPALASQELAKSKNCLSCHMADSTFIDPSIKDLRERYSGKKDIHKVLVNHVRKGSVGQWGTIPMPINPQVTEEEAFLLVKWMIE